MSKSIFRRSSNRLLHLVARMAPGATSLRPWIHRLRGVIIGPEVWIGDDVYLDNEYPECIELQAGASISMRATLLAHTKGAGRIIVEKDAFVGPHAILCCSGGRELRIGAGAVVGAGCVVTRSIPARTFVVSPPLQPIAEITVLYGKADDTNHFVSGLVPVRPGKRPRSSG